MQAKLQKIEHRCYHALQEAAEKEKKWNAKNPSCGING